MSAPVFKDLDKSAVDVITKNFPAGTQTFEVEGGSVDGVKFRATGVQAGDSLSSQLETSKVFATHGASLKAIAKSVLGTPVYTLEGTFEPTQVPGLKATLTSECKIPESGQVDTNKLTLLYKRGLVTVEETISYSHGKLAFVTSAAFVHQAIRAGAQVLSSFTSAGEAENKFKITGYGVKLGYVPYNTLAVVANYDQTASSASAGATVYYRKDITETATQVVLDPQNPSKAPTFTFAVSHAYDAKTSLKARITTANNAVALSVRHQLTPSLAVTIGSESVGYLAKADAAKPAVAKHGIAINLQL